MLGTVILLYWIVQIWDPPEHSNHDKREYHSNPFVNSCPRLRCNGLQNTLIAFRSGLVISRLATQPDPITTEESMRQKIKSLQGTVMSWFDDNTS